MADIFEELGLPRPEPQGDIFDELGLPKPPKKAVARARPTEGDIFKEINLPRPEKIPVPEPAIPGFIPEFVKESGPYQQIVETARKSEGRKNLYKARSLKREFEGPPKILEKAAKTAATARGPFKEQVQEQAFETAESQGMAPAGSMEKLRQQIRSRSRIAPPKEGGGRFPKELESIIPKEKRVDPYNRVPRTLEWLDIIFGAPYRVFGAATESAKEQLTHAMTPEGFHSEAPESPLKKIWESFTYEKPIYMGNVFANSLKQSLGRDLSDTENTVAHLGGLFAEIFGPGQALKVLRLGRGKPPAEGLANQAERALTKSGQEVEGLRRTFWRGRPKLFKSQPVSAEGGMITRKLIDNIAVDALSQPSRAQQIAKVREGLFVIGKNMGLSDEMIATIDNQFMRQIGTRGGKFAKSGLHLPTSGEAAEGARMKEAARLGGAPEVPLGAERTGLSRLPGIGELFYGKEAAKGTAEALRPATAYRALEEKGALETGKKMQKLIGDRGVEASRYRDLRGVLEKVDHHLEGLAAELEDVATTPARAKAINLEMKTTREGFQRALDRAGLTEAEVRAGFKASTPEEVRAVKTYEDGMREMRSLEQRFGIDEGNTTSYVYRTLTPEMKRLRKEVLGPKAGRATSKAQFQRSRMLVGEGGESVSIAGTRGKEFVEPLASNYVARRRASAFAVSNRMAEDAITKGYGTLVTPEMAGQQGFRSIEELISSKQFLTRMKSRGLVVYRIKTGPQAGQMYLLDGGTAAMLEKALNPKSMNQYLRMWTKVNNWWKSRATVLRPGFMFRNVFGGNVWQMWLADADLMWSMPMGMKAMRQIARRYPVGGSTLMRHQLEVLAEESGRALGKAARAGSIEIRPGLTLDQAIDLGLENGVTGMGFFGYELGEQGTRAGWRQAINPVSKDFIVSQMVGKLNRLGEDWARWSLFLDRLRKGYSAEDAAAAVGKYLFNYNELSAVGGAARHVFPFATWNLKNWGMQISTLLNKPDKFFNFLRMWYGVQDIDPPSEEELRDMPDWSKRQMAFFVPGKRGEEGFRQYFIGAGVFPMTSLLQLQPEEVPGTVISMMHPWIRRMVEMTAGASEENRKSFWSAPTRPEKRQLVIAPTWVKHVLMEPLKEHHPELWKVLANPEYGVFPAFYDYSTGEQTGYKWEVEMAELFADVDPGMGILNRLSRPQVEQVYDTFQSILLGYKLYELTPERMRRERQRRIDKTLKEQGDLEYKLKSLGQIPDPRNPLRNVPY